MPHPAMPRLLLRQKMIHIRLSVLSILCLGVANTSAIAQKPLFRASSTGDFPYQLTGPQTTTRDSRAIQIIQTVIEASGGESAWSNVTKSTSLWTLSDPNQPSFVATANWIDDWRGGLLVFSHETTNDTGIHTFYSTSDHRVGDQEPTGTTALPQELQEIALPWHLPAAVLQLELNNPAYKIQYLGLDSTNDSIAFLRIIKISPDGFADPYTLQNWKIDLSTGLPAEVNFYTLDLKRNVSYPVSVGLSQYRVVDGLEVPSVLSFGETGKLSLFTLKSLSLQ
jgi:hypothetical protein